MSKPDRNFISYADSEGLEILNLTVDPGPEGDETYDDLLKLSHVRSASFRNLVVLGGRQKENAIDLNRGCLDVLIDGAVVQGGRQNAITIKGGCSDITLRDVTIKRGGGNCDIELGNHSDQNFNRTRRVRLIRVRMDDGSPVRLRVGHADEPSIVDCEVERQFRASLGVKFYVAARQLYARLRGLAP